jgi:hypothetical protein
MQIVLREGIYNNQTIMTDTDLDSGMLGDLNNPKGCRNLLLIMLISLIIMFAVAFMLL